jgi:hypothetical protein
MINGTQASGERASFGGGADDDSTYYDQCFCRCSAQEWCGANAGNAGKAPRPRIHLPSPPASEPAGQENCHGADHKPARRQAPIMINGTQASGGRASFGGGVSC